MAIEAPELTVSIEKPGAWARRLTITVPADRIAREKRQAVERLSKRLRVPGFRAGKVPAAVMEKKYGAAIEQETVEKVIGDAYRATLKSEGLEPISQASVEEVNYEPGTDLTFAVEFEIRPEIELNRVGGFTVVREQTPVADQQIDDVLQRLREENALWRTKTDATPVAGDMATVEITPLDDHTSAEPREPRRYQIVIGQDQAARAVEDAIITLKPGETAEFDVDLHDDGTHEGSETPHTHRMRISMLDLQSPELPELDDEFATGLGDFDSLETLRARIREDLEREAAREAERGVRMQLVQQIIEANPFEVPRTMVHNYLERVMPVREGAEAERVEEMRMQLWPAAEQAIKRSLVVERVAEMESLAATPSEMDARLDEIAERMGRNRSDVISQLRKAGRLEEIEQEITEEKVFGYLMSISEIQ